MTQPELGHRAALVVLVGQHGVARAEVDRRDAELGEPLEVLRFGDPLPVSIEVGEALALAAAGQAMALGATDFTAKRTSPCWPLPFTLGNSPPSTR